MKYLVKVTFADGESPKTKTFKVAARNAEAAQDKVDMELRDGHTFPNRRVSTVHAARPIKEEKSTKKKFYVRATGDNRYAGGSSRWLRIRSISADGSKLEIRTQRGPMFIGLPADGSVPKNLRFSADYPAGRNAMFSQVKQHLQESSMKLTKTQLTEMIRETVREQLTEEYSGSIEAERLVSMAQQLASERDNPYKEINATALDFLREAVSLLEEDEARMW